MKKYHVKVLVPHEFYIDAENFEECMVKITDELPQNYNGDGITISVVGDKNEKDILFEEFPRR